MNHVATYGLPLLAVLFILLAAGAIYLNPSATREASTVSSARDQEALVEQGNLFYLRRAEGDIERGPHDVSGRSGPTYQELADAGLLYRCPFYSLWASEPQIDPRWKPI